MIIKLVPRQGSGKRSRTSNSPVPVVLNLKSEAQLSLFHYSSDKKSVPVYCTGAFGLLLVQDTKIRIQRWNLKPCGKGSSWITAWLSWLQNISILGQKLLNQLNFKALSHMSQLTKHDIGVSKKLLSQLYIAWKTALLSSLLMKMFNPGTFPL